MFKKLDVDVFEMYCEGETCERTLDDIDGDAAYSKDCKELQDYAKHLGWVCIDGKWLCGDCNWDRYFDQINQERESV